MCIGIPMKVVETRPGRAICESAEGRREIDMTLVGDQPEGTWVLTFLDTAREVVTAEQAQLVGRALTAVGLAMTGEVDVDHLFPDLAGREPELPDFLKAQIASKEEEFSQ